MKNFWGKLNKPFFVLAPMAGYTDQPFRLICKKFGADVLYSEMVSSEALFHNRLKLKVKSEKLKINESRMQQLFKTLKLIQFSKKERPFVVQIFGSDPDKTALSAEYIATGKWAKDYKKIIKSLEIGNCNLEIMSIPDGIDINMGCPVHDVVKTGAGAALMKNVANAQKIVYKIKKRVKNIPISVKTRLGWSDPKDILIFLRRLEYAGVDALAIHGRTYKQGFSGKVDWDMIYKVKKQLSIPVIGNGGINVQNVQNVEVVENESKRIQQVKRLNNFNLNLDGYMVGRGTLGKPWIFDEVKNQVTKKFQVSKQNIKKVILEHARLVDKLKGKQGIIEFRKHFAWYLKGFSGGKKLREKAVKVEKMKDIIQICKDMV